MLTCRSLTTSSAPHAAVFFGSVRPPPRTTLFPYTTLFRSHHRSAVSDFDLHECRIRRQRSRGRRRCRTRSRRWSRSEEHTSELQSRLHLVCRLLLEKINELTYPAAAESRQLEDPLHDGLGR